MIVIRSAVQRIANVAVAEKNMLGLSVVNAFFFTIVFSSLSHFIPPSKQGKAGEKPHP